MLTHFILSLALFCAISAVAERGDSSDTAYRPAFTLRVPIDATHYVEAKKPRLPCISRGEVGLFYGDHFGLKIDVQDNNVRSVKYERDLSKADVTLEFKKGDPVDGKTTSLLMMQNRTKYTFVMDAAMEVPGRNDFIRTAFFL